MGEKKIIQRGYGSLRSLLGAFRGSFRISWRPSGFTLVELLVVVSIIGILVVAALAILNPISQIQKGNDAKRKEDLSQLQKALETHYHDLGKYPQSNADYKIFYNNSTVSWGSTGFAPYMSILPQDPHKNKNYVYFSSLDQQSYRLYAALERTSDPQLCPNGVCPNLPGGAMCGSGVTCNFGVSSSNVSP